MDWSDSISVAATFIVSLGGGGAIVLAPIKLDRQITSPKIR